MIVPRGRQIWRMLHYVGRSLLFLIAWDFAIVIAYQGLHWEWVGSRHVPLALYGGAISIVVGFRNNSSYARWWEARGLWGQIVNNSRSLARQVITTMRPTHPDDGAEAAQVLATQKRLVYHQIAYVHALRQQLRGLPAWDEIRPFLSTEELTALEPEKNVPLALQCSMAQMISDARETGWIDGLEWQALDGSLDDLTDAQGGAERIKNTPMPKQYDYFPMLFVQIYCLVLPIGLVETLGWYTPLGSTLVGFMFLALDKIGRDLEDPFDNTVFDIPMTAITTTIETNLRQLLREPELPPATRPVAGVLW